MKNDDVAKKVVLDTNSLIYSVKYHVDLRDQITFLLGRSEIIDPVNREKKFSVFWMNSHGSLEAF